MGDLFVVSPAEPGYPRRLLDCYGPAHAPTITCRGDPEIMHASVLALLCSRHLPGATILETYDFTRRFPPGELVVAGGFHSPMEQQCLEILLVRHVPVILCPAHRLMHTRLPVPYRNPLREGRLLLLSPFGPGEKRVNRSLARARNLFVAALSTGLLVPWAAPGGATEELVIHSVHQWAKPVWCFGMGEPGTLFPAGAQLTTAKELASLLAERWNPEQRVPRREMGRK